MSQYNFSPGPALLPAEVLEKIRTCAFDFHQGLSIFELSHRHPKVEEALWQAEQEVRTLLQVPASYHVVFTTGGARAQFSLVPLHWLTVSQDQHYVVTGHWSRAAYEAACSYGYAKLLYSTQDQGFTTIPTVDWYHVIQGSYIHYTDNETIQGVAFHQTPCAHLPLVVDMTSSLLTRPIDIERYGLIYAAAQKNLGIAGITLVIVNPDILPTTRHTMVPPVYDYRFLAQHQSLCNTPPVFNWYVLGLVCAWVRQQGGVSALQKRNMLKATKIYDYIAAEPFYQNSVIPEARSQLTIPVMLAKPELTTLFCELAEQRGLYHLQGHPTVGGIRVSLYNAMPIAAVEALIEFMKDFVQRYA